MNMMKRETMDIAAMAASPYTPAAVFSRMVEMLAMP